MISKFITALRQTTPVQDATGTFADGAFPLTAREQLWSEKGNCLRNSYGRDYQAAHTFERSPAVHA